MGLLDKFKRNKDGASEDAPVRLLESPGDLMKGDLVSFKLFAPEILRRQTYAVKAINTYDFGSRVETEFVLEGADDEVIAMKVENDRGREVLCLSAPVHRSDVEKMFDMGEFSKIIDQECGEVRVHCKTSCAPELFAEWVAESYVRDGYLSRGYLHHGDFRNKELSEFAEDGIEFDRYTITSPDRTKSLSISVYDSGDWVSVSLLSDESIIEEMWPAK